MGNSTKRIVDVEANFWSKVDKKGPDECWDWLANDNGRGYGVFYIYRRVVYAHRYVYELTFGPFDKKLDVCHKCGNNSCCNPGHLFLTVESEKKREKRRSGYKVNSIEEMFFSKITPGLNNCIIYTGFKNKHGYGQFSAGLRAGKHMPAHRWSYEFYKGKIPAGLVLDHLCRNPSCVNPEHLEPVTNAENIRRGITATKLYCKNGHPFDDTNTHRNSKGHRTCRTCVKLRLRKIYARRKSQIA